MTTELMTLAQQHIALRIIAAAQNLESLFDQDFTGDEEPPSDFETLGDAAHERLSELLEEWEYLALESELKPAEMRELGCPSCGVYEADECTCTQEQRRAATAPKYPDEYVAFEVEPGCFTSEEEP